MKRLKVREVPNSTRVGLGLGYHCATLMSADHNSMPRETITVQYIVVNDFYSSIILLASFLVLMYDALLAHYLVVPQLDFARKA